MSIPLTKLNRGGPDGSVMRVRNLLVNMQRDMRDNAAIHKSVATSASLPLDKLQTQVSDCAASYLRLLGHIAAIRNDPERNAALLTRLSHHGFVEADVINVFEPLHQAALTLRDASKKSYADIVTACNAVLTHVTPHEIDPEKVWEV